jgi:hypothetical protein
LSEARPSTTALAENLGQRADFVHRVLGGNTVAVDLDGAEVVEVALPVLVDADTQPDAGGIDEPGASQLADGVIEGRGAGGRGLGCNTGKGQQQRTPQDRRAKTIHGRASSPVHSRNTTPGGFSLLVSAAFTSPIEHVIRRQHQQ